MRGPQADAQAATGQVSLGQRYTKWVAGHGWAYSLGRAGRPRRNRSSFTLPSPILPSVRPAREIIVIHLSVILQKSDPCFELT